jgi:hypothetical protein
MESVPPSLSADDDGPDGGGAPDRAAHATPAPHPHPPTIAGSGGADPDSSAHVVANGGCHIRRLPAWSVVNSHGAIRVWSRAVTVHGQLLDSGSVTVTVSEPHPSGTVTVSESDSDSEVSTKLDKY